MSSSLSASALQALLNAKVRQYNQSSFIEHDPISIPHAFSKLQDIEVAGLLSAVLAWGRRSVAMRKAQLLMQMMDNAPHAFVLESSSRDLSSLQRFKHRTFQGEDLMHILRFLRGYYRAHVSLETAFTAGMGPQDASVETALKHFHNACFGPAEVSNRTRKHIPTPEKGSACKRMTMFLRWMVRKDQAGVDFGLWKNILPHQLVCPCDVHVKRTALRLGLLQTKTVGWQAALELTDALKRFCPEDPVKYDFALFGLGMESI